MFYYLENFVYHWHVIWRILLTTSSTLRTLPEQMQRSSCPNPGSGLMPPSYLEGGGCWLDDWQPSGGIPPQLTDSGLVRFRWAHESWIQRGLKLCEAGVRRPPNVADLTSRSGSAPNLLWEESKPLPCHVLSFWSVKWAEWHVPCLLLQRWIKAGNRHGNTLKRKVLSEWKGLPRLLQWTVPELFSVLIKK